MSMIPGMHPMSASQLQPRQLTNVRSALVAVVTLVVAMVVVAGNASGVVVATQRGSAGEPVVPYGAVIKPAIAAKGRDISGSIAVPGGGVRTYTLYVPKSLPKGTPAPLLVGLHGGLGSGRQFEQNTDFDGLAEANRFIVVYPNGTPIRPALPDRLVWNGGGCCSVAEQSQENVNDVGFISALITKIEHQYDIDKSRVYATGHSNGAILAERLACQLSNQIVGIGVQAGDLFINRCMTSRPVAVLEIHGTDDQNIPISGGIGSRSLTQADFPPPVDGLKTLAMQDKCPSAPTNSVDPSSPAVNFEIWQPCDAGTMVEWAKVTGANHAWMGHPASPGTESLVGTPYMGFDSSAAIWSFLSAHPRH
jgi:polyhydroxybutyrate depolymerase